MRWDHELAFVDCRVHRLPGRRRWSYPIGDLDPEDAGLELDPCALPEAIPLAMLASTLDAPADARRRAVPPGLLASVLAHALFLALACLAGDRPGEPPPEAAMLVELVDLAGGGGAEGTPGPGPALAPGPAPVAPAVPDKRPEPVKPPPEKPVRRQAKATPAKRPAKEAPAPVDQAAVPIPDPAAPEDRPAPEPAPAAPASAPEPDQGQVPSPAPAAQDGPSASGSPVPADAPAPGSGSASVPGSVSGRAGTSGGGSGGGLGLSPGQRVDQPPRVLSQVKPRYPAVARKLNKSGVVTLKFLVDGQGQPTQLTVLEAPPGGFFERSALEAVARWRFEPARLHGKKVPVWMILPVRFVLEK